ncbi:hypothetical protein D0T50_11225 [Bacteroides sp. 214]|nr:hypothetical protein [Bacteroides sp. 214]
MQFLSIPVVVGICVYGTYKLFELFAHRRERLNLIEKLDASMFVNGSNNGVQLPVFSNSSFSFSALKMGCLLVGLGLGLLVGYLICLNSIPDYLELDNKKWIIREAISLIYGASVLFFGGFGLLTAFLIEMNIAKKEKKN